MVHVQNRPPGLWGGGEPCHVLPGEPAWEFPLPHRQASCTGVAPSPGRRNHRQSACFCFQTGQLVVFPRPCHMHGQKRGSNAGKAGTGSRWHHLPLPHSQPSGAAGMCISAAMCIRPVGRMSPYIFCLLRRLHAGRMLSPWAPPRPQVVQGG